MINFSLEENKVLVRRYLEEIWNNGNLTVVDEIIAEDFIFHRPVGDLKGPGALKQYVGAFHKAFPDIHFTLDNQIAEQDEIVTVWTMTGTHKDEIMGITATNKSIRLSGVSITRCAGGKVTENTTYWDRLALMQQLGVIPR